MSQDQTQLDRIEAKIDLLFGTFSNDLLAKQAIDAYHAVAAKKDPGENEKNIMAQSEQAFKNHNKSMIDSISYYIDLYGSAANEKLVKLLDALGYKEQKGDTEFVEAGLNAGAGVAANSTRKSEKV